MDPQRPRAWSANWADKVKYLSRACHWWIPSLRRSCGTSIEHTWVYAGIRGHGDMGTWGDRHGGAPTEKCLGIRSQECLRYHLCKPVNITRVYSERALFIT